MATWTTRLFDEIGVGESASYARTLDAADIELLVMLTGDRIASETNHRPLGAGSTHGIGGSVLLATVVGTQLPGPGAHICEQTLRFNGRLAVGDVLTATVTVREKKSAGRQLLLDAKCSNQHGQTVTEGTLLVDCPTERRRVERLGEVEVAFHRYNAFQAIFERAQGQPPVPTAVVHPCDTESLLGALDAAAKGLITPVLVGPEAKIRAVAAAANIDLAGYRIVATEHSHAAASKAVAMARAGEVEALMKGSLHTDELMGAVVADGTGLRTDRRVSHVFVMDVPTYPKPLLVTDAAVNIHPDLETKRDICQNAIDFAHVLGIDSPKVAILSAVETVNPKIQGTLDAAALCKMAERGQITGATLDGPLAFDNAISAAAAKIKGIVSPVAGNADILVVPDLEAGNILAKELSYLAAAESAGIVLGAKVPIALTSRADSARTREASAAVMVLLARALRRRAEAR
ncbi:MAG TPA: bifunctional enoyl-CoA hydratase/phosphate acetyltransferase [Casimicrobiaceae bacterium]|jgi:phosphotransacetylase/acyl dehydratase|nr:bifunctional enoyl-CoA hydratase/phosphate acetyltransferase [Casimicrobiaceae bacterium]